MEGCCITNVCRHKKGCAPKARDLLGVVEKAARRGHQHLAYSISHIQCFALLDLSRAGRFP